MCSSSSQVLKSILPVPASNGTLIQTLEFILVEQLMRSLERFLRAVIQESGERGNTPLLWLILVGLCVFDIGKHLSINFLNDYHFLFTDYGETILSIYLLELGTPPNHVNMLFSGLTFAIYLLLESFHLFTFLLWLQQFIGVKWCRVSFDKNKRELQSNH